MRKALSVLLALVLAFTCLTLSGCGSKNKPTDDNIDMQDDTQVDTYIEDDNMTDDSSETYIEGDNTGDNSSEDDAENTENTGSDNSKVEKDADGLYVYKLCNESVEIHINTNVWDYIDSDNVWDATRMAEDLGFPTPVYWDKMINGFESENKIYEIIVYYKYELYEADSFDYALNSYDRFPGYSFHFTGGSEWSNRETKSDPADFGVEIYDEQFRERAKYGIKDTNVHKQGYMIGVSLETIVFTAAAMEECNGMIPDNTISDCLTIYLFDPNYYLLP